MTTKTELILSARDETRAAFDSVNGALSRMSGSSINLANSFKAATLSAAGLAGVGSFAVLKGKIDDAISSMAGLKDSSEATGAAVENLSGLKTVAKIGGREWAEIEGSIIRLNKALHGTDDESKGAGKALAALGLDIRELRQMDPAEAFYELARAQEKFADGGGKSAALVAILGKSGAGAIPYLHDLAEQMGIVGKVTSQQARDADEYEKNIKRLQGAWGALSRQMAAAVVGPAKDVTDWMVKAQKEGGALYSILVGIGMATSKALGVEINPLKRADLDANETFEKLAKARQALAALKAQQETENPLYRFVTGFDIKRLEKEIPELEKKLKGFIRTRNGLLKDAAVADEPKDTSLNSQTFGKDAADGKGKKESDKAADLIATLDKQIAVKALDLQTTEKLSEAEKQLAEVQATIDNGTLKATARQRELIEGKLQFLIVADKELASQERYRQALDAQQKAMDDHFPKLEEEAKKLERQATLYGLTQAQLAAVTESRLEEAIAIAKANGASDDQIEFLERELAVRKRMTTALQQMQDQQESLNETTDEFAKQAARNMQDTLAEFLFDPFKHGTEGMLQGFGTMIQKMIAQAVAADLGKRLFGSLVQGGEGDGWLGGAMKWLGGLFPNADGGVYPGAAGLSAYSGTIVSRPTVFPFAKGVGLMGEAGPEAILPLKRGADGKLGVSSGGGGHTINVYVSGTSAPDVRRAAGQGAREALAALNGARRYG